MSDPNSPDENLNDRGEMELKKRIPDIIEEEEDEDEEISDEKFHDDPTRTDLEGGMRIFFEDLDEKPKVGALVGFMGKISGAVGRMNRVHRARAQKIFWSCNFALYNVYLIWAIVLALNSTEEEDDDDDG